MPAKAGISLRRRYLWNHGRRLDLHHGEQAGRHDTIIDAIAREKALKAWKREWKVALIEAANPSWADLFERIA